MKLNKRLILLRKTIRERQGVIIDITKKNHLKKASQQTKMCIFCGASKNLTKEHMLPKWVFNNCDKRFFTTITNNTNQTYSQTTLPACKNCNSFILGYLETHIKDLFQNIDLVNNFFSNDELEKVILWLELIEYKFQFLDIKRKFNRHKDGEYIKFLANFPIAMLNNIESSPTQIFSNLRKSLKKLSVKSKENRLNSLLIFKTSNPDFHFFHKTDDFLFLELPDYGIAMFYFINKEFEQHELAHESAMNIIKTQYKPKDNKLVK